MICTLHLSIASSSKLTKVLGITWPRSIDFIGLGPNGNLQGRGRYFSFEMVLALYNQWQDVEAFKTPIRAISSVNYVCEQKKDIKVIKLRDF